MALFSHPHPSSRLPTLSPYSPSKPQLRYKPYNLYLKPSRPLPGLLLKATENGPGGVASSAPTVEENVPEPSPTVAEKKDETSLGSNGSVKAEVKFEDPRWINGTWDLRKFQKDGKTNWDAVIDAEVRRRKWLEDNPETSSNDEPVVFETSIIPWWAWMKRFHLPEAELLNGRAAMIGFFMAYLVDSLTGIGLVDQMGNLVCKILLLVAVVGVLVIRKNEDVETIKKLIEETTFYDKQWQATWQDDNSSSKNND